MRGKKAPKRKIKPDPKFSNMMIAKFTNCLMLDGKKSVAQAIVYDCFDFITEKTKQDPLEVFDKAVKNITPSLEVKGRRIGGANYQVPVVVSGDRKMQLAFRWIIESIRKKKGKPTYLSLANELMDAANNEGDAIKKKIDMHKMAEANKAFAHFAR
ncbi:MAG: 30S ribosomal protein S7 [Parcubacteria group bacterium CG1_02_37_51]|uniref:Small ribosomal subunit protein uS7 n=2 Tax=Candidatus Komeiliibacteriota TaxID=1817908 RepID=A0A2M8DSJ4_9BACT|nr:MAG: 30S ribosomal protein S7 [Parcubacteria group bacterium CG1_02_37_51]PIY94931.1 MAG: 30S ribosomal protein S7 [Candidatus Komeilibacteria bacterium CG_4_10_14_0_8_um_filter_37_78]PJC02324.1 MAG: 30S ribosomal protein S7 [Candidatus Komeilibacteria bacterium CG_4_9_14_0_8_um_filter_36_9]